MKFFIGLLCVCLALASPTPDIPKEPLDVKIIGIQGLPLEARSAPGVLQPLTEFDETIVPHHEEDSSAHSVGNHVGYERPVIQEEYGVPKIFDEYGPPKVHDEYGPPVVPTLKTVTDHYCPEEDIESEFVRAPPPPPEIIPLPEIPIVKYEPIVPEVVHEEYGIPEVPHVVHEDYGVPVVPPVPLCPNGSPDTSYPFCCENGAANPFCCTGEWISPTCSEPKIIEVAHEEKVIEYPYPPKRLCVNGAEDSTYPFCCENGATNEYCCLGIWVNPTCSEPTTTTTTPAPLCPNGSPDTSYPFCCENGAANPYCCTGEWINPTCSEPTTTTPVPTVKLAPYPAPTTTTTTPVPFVPKSPYAGKVYSKYEDSHVGKKVSSGITHTNGITGTVVKETTGFAGTRTTGTTGTIVTGFSGEGLIDVRVPEIRGIGRSITKTGVTQGRIIPTEVRGRTISTGPIVGTRVITTGEHVTGGSIIGGTVRGLTSRIEVTGRRRVENGKGSTNRIEGTNGRRLSGISGRTSTLIRSTPVKTIRFIAPGHTRTRTVVRRVSH